MLMRQSGAFQPLEDLVRGNRLASYPGFDAESDAQGIDAISPDLLLTLKQGAGGRCGGPVASTLPAGDVKGDPVASPYMSKGASRLSTPQARFKRNIEILERPRRDPPVLHAPV